MEKTLREKIWRNKCKLAFLLLAVGVLYANSLSAGFVWDDKSLIVKKQDFFGHPENAVKLLVLSDAPIGEENPYYRPLNTLSYMLDHYLWGVHPFWYHLENVLLHALVVMVFYLLLLEVFGDGRLAFIAAVLFAVYPVNAEAVDAIFNRNVLFCALFTLASLLFLARGRKKMSFLAYFLALLSKEPGIVLPFFLLSFGLTTGGKFKIKKDVLAGFLGVTAIYLVIRRFVLGVFSSGPGVELSFARLKLISMVYFEHFRLFVFPYHLNAFYASSRIVFSPVKCLFAILGVLLLLYVSLKKKTPDVVRAGAQWIFWGLLPVSNIVLIPSAPVAERYQYTVIFGFVLILGYLLDQIQRRKVLAGSVLASAIVLALGARTFERNFAWHDDVSLFSSMVRSDPGSSKAHCFLGLTYEKKGMLEMAEKQCDAAHKLDPNYGEAFACQGLIYAKQGLPLESMAAFQRAVKAAPDSEEAHMDLAVAYMNENMAADAEREFRTVISLNSDYMGAHMDLAELYLKEKRNGDAEREFKDVLELDPDKAKAHSGLGLIYAGRGDLNNAIPEFRKALSLNASLLGARLNLAVAYAKEGGYQNAAAELQKVLKLYPGNAQATEYLSEIEGVKGKQ